MAHFRELLNPCAIMIGLISQGYGLTLDLARKTAMAHYIIDLHIQSFIYVECVYVG